MGLFSLKTFQTEYGRRDHLLLDDDSLLGKGTDKPQAYCGIEKPEDVSVVEHVSKNSIEHLCLTCEYLSE